METPLEISLPRLNLPHYPHRIKSSEKGAYIFDRVRKKYVRLTPEEWVRQNFIAYLVNGKKYPAGLMAIEKRLLVNNMERRADIVIHSRDASPYIIVECKAPFVEITQAVMDQAVAYNMTLGCRILCLTNGLKHVYAMLDHHAGRFSYLRELPDYTPDNR